MSDNLVPAKGEIIIRDPDNWCLLDADEAVDYDVTVRIHTGCRRDSPGWQATIDEMLSKGKYGEIMVITPLIKSGRHYINIGHDKEGHTTADCTRCGWKGVLVRNHICDEGQPQ